MCTMMTVIPTTAMAAGSVPETDLTEAVAEAIIEQADLSLRESILAEDPEGLLQPEEENVDAAAFVSEPVTDPNAVSLVFNGMLLEMDNYARLHEGVTCVPVRDFFEAMGCTVTWDPSVSKILVTRADGLNMELQPGSRLAVANGRYWYMASACTGEDGMALIPLRDAAKVFSGEVTWDSITRTAYIVGGGLLESGDTYYDAEDLLWIARIVRHEAGNQPLDGKVAVANVIINRMNDPAFPNTAEEVIYDTRTGVQFVTRSSKSILKEPSEQCFLAAKLALEGYETAPDCLYFASNAVAKRCWAGRNRQVYTVIGGHTFFL